MKKLYVGNLSYDTTEESLMVKFASFGDVLSVFIPVDKFSLRPKGFAFVEFADSDAAADAVAQMNGREVDGRTVKVDTARPPVERAGHDPLEPQYLQRLIQEVFETELRPTTIPQSVALIEDFDELMLWLIEQPEDMYELPHRRFEELIAFGMERKGFTSKVTKATRDHGLDVIASRSSFEGDVVIGIQAKDTVSATKSGSPQ